MSQITISFSDGQVRSFTRGLSLFGANPLPHKSKEILAAKWNGQMVDLSFQPQTDGQAEFLTFNDEEGQEIYRHSTAHILAQAVKRLFPGTVLGIGPAIADGFYYDFDSQHKFTPDDLAAIEAKMRKIISENHSYQRLELPRNEAIEFFEKAGEPYKVELIQDLPRRYLSVSTGRVNCGAPAHVPLPEVRL